MIRILDAGLPDAAVQNLLTLQAEVDAMPSYAARVQLARQRFEAVNRRGNETFDTVRATLRSMCAGARRCMYCEDSMADEVEHFRPKVFYPDLVFVWLNYLYSCGICNKVKRHHFRILCETGAHVDLVKDRSGTLSEPARGSATLIDPRTEDPQTYLTLDLIDTFCFVPKPSAGTPDHARATYTISRLRLNDRDDLLRARAQAYGNYRAKLREYIAARGTPQGNRLADALIRCDHPTVWAEMKAQHQSIPELLTLFSIAPEVHMW